MIPNGLSFPILNYDFRPFDNRHLSLDNSATFLISGTNNLIFKIQLIKEIGMPQELKIPGRSSLLAPLSPDVKKDSNLEELQATFDVILQETFTVASSRQFPRGRISPVGGGYLHPDLTRPPHVTLLWQQQLDGRSSVTGPSHSQLVLDRLLQRLKNAHQYCLMDADYDSNVLLTLVKEQQIAHLLVSVSAASAPDLSRWFAAGAIDKLICIVHPALGGPCTAPFGLSLPITLKNVHIEQIPSAENAAHAMPLVLLAEPAYLN
jgi:hypothetical protein